MAPSLADSGEIIKDAIVETGKIADNPSRTLAFILIGIISAAVVFVGFGGYYILNTLGRPMLEANLESVKASTEAIRSNAETNRQMAKAIEDIKLMDAKKMDAIERLQKSQEQVLDNVSQALKDHQKIMSSIQLCAPAKSNGG